jgi:hypothetical protein
VKRPRRNVWIIWFVMLVLGVGLIVGRNTRTRIRPLARVNHSTDAEANRIHAVLINGGANAAKNYQSHLLHVRSFVSLLRARGVRPHEISIFASDGPDTGRDLAVRNIEPEEYFWILEALPVRGKLANKVHLVDSRIEGFELHPATRPALQDWFAKSRRILHAGDTLVVYVTDHGRRNTTNLANNSISLWHDQLSVQQLQQMIALVPQGVRIVTLMSQCYSGSFAGLLYDPNRGRTPYGDVCGYFSSTADRQAYGCYSENRGKENVGHSFRFLEALGRTDAFTEAHDHVLLSDRTPDVPHRTSDAYGHDLLTAAAARTREPFDRFVDSLLPSAYLDEARFREAFWAIDRLGESFGAFGPRSLAELERMAARVPLMADRLSEYAKEWKTVLFNLEREHFAKFLSMNGHWRDGVDPTLLDELRPRQRHSVVRWLTRDLVTFAREETPSTWERLLALRTFAEESSHAAYRMRVREAAVLRLRMMLERIAAQVWLLQSGTDAQLGAYESLVECENLQLGPRKGWLRSASRAPEPYPELAAELDLIDGVLPGWIGIEHGPANDILRRTHKLARGASTVLKVLANSPAARSGIRVGDVIVGSPGEPFVERNRLREWIMTSIAGNPRELEILRAGVLRTISVEIGKRNANTG